MLRRNYFNLSLALIVVVTTLVAATPSRAATQEQVLNSFQEGDGNNGVYPASRVILDSIGNLYGTASLGGANGVGAVFQLTPVSGGGGWTFTLIHSFNGTGDGENPRSGLLLDKSGNLYGTTTGAGSSVFGTAFELSPAPAGWTFDVIHNFTGGADGGFPSSDLIADSSGALYGVTSAGGASANCDFGCGTVFELKRSGNGEWKEQILYSFQGGLDGREPIGALALDHAGNLYGLTAQGGSNQCTAGCGTAFKLNRTPNGTWQKTTLPAFADKAHGWFPYGGVIFDQTGNLYGTTGAGGNLNCNPPNGCGTVFRLDPNGAQIVIHSFAGTGGGGMVPQAGLVLGAAGHLYGTTSLGGQLADGCASGCGTVFEVMPTGKLKTLYKFKGEDGAMPEAPLLWDGARHFYGTTFEGGTGTVGTVFELTR